MWLYVAKVAPTSLVVVAVTEVARRSTFWAAALAQEILWPAQVGK